MERGSVSILRNVSRCVSIETHVLLVIFALLMPLTLLTLRRGNSRDENGSVENGGRLSESSYSIK